MDWAEQAAAKAAQGLTAGATLLRMSGFYARSETNDGPRQEPGLIVRVSPQR